MGRSNAQGPTDYSESESSTLLCLYTRAGTPLGHTYSEGATWVQVTGHPEKQAKKPRTAGSQLPACNGPHNRRPVGHASQYRVSSCEGTQAAGLGKIEEICSHPQERQGKIGPREARLRKRWAAEEHRMAKIAGESQSRCCSVEHACSNGTDEVPPHVCTTPQEHAVLCTRGFVCSASGEGTAHGVNLYENMAAAFCQNEAAGRTHTPSKKDENLKHNVSTACRPRMFQIALFKGFLNLPHIPPPPPRGTHNGHK